MNFSIMVHIFLQLQMNDFKLTGPMHSKKENEVIITE